VINITSKRQQQALQFEQLGSVSGEADVAIIITWLSFLVVSASKNDKMSHLITLIINQPLRGKETFPLNKNPN